MRAHRLPLLNVRHLRFMPLFCISVFPLLLLALTEDSPKLKNSLLKAVVDITSAYTVIPCSMWIPLDSSLVDLS